MSGNVAKCHPTGPIIAGKLSARQESAILALLANPTISRSALSAGVTERTLFRWLQVPVFQEAYRQARRDSISQALAGLQQAAAEAVETLLDVARARVFTTPAARVSAARAILEFAMKGIELEDIDARLSALEDMLQGNDGET